MELSNKIPSIPVKNRTNEMLNTTEKYVEINLFLLKFSSGNCLKGMKCFSKIKKPSIKRTLRAGNFFLSFNKRIFTHSKKKALNGLRFL